MPTATRTFRVFVSSTFEDLKLERNALQDKVFPDLVKLCSEKGARFQAIDLRWGVREEAGFDQRTMEICKAEIARCKKTGIKPNFIVLLGDRYGWRPLPARIQKNEFEVMNAHLNPEERRLLVFDEDEHAADNGWYRLDNNAVPPEYLLKPREGEYKERSSWSRLEVRIRDALQRAARAAGLSEADLGKYEASATHQEILDGLGETPEDREHVFAFVRNPDAPKEPELEKLIKTLNGQLPGRVYPFTGGSLDALCQQVISSLKRVIEAEASRFEVRTPLEQEKAAHKAFAEDRRKQFVGQDTVRSAIKDYLNGGHQQPLVVYGPSGSGKSAIMAMASEDREGIRRFIGATPAASSGLTLLRSLCEEIGERYGQGGDLPATFNELIVLFQERLRLAKPDRPLILYIDALDQLGPQDPAAEVNWLPRELPQYCRIVFSTIDMPAALSGPQSVRVEPFSDQDAHETLKLWLKETKRTLQKEQRDKLLAGFQPTGLPLYLKLAFEEARLWRSFDPGDHCVLGGGLTGIIDGLFARLSEPGNHGRVLVSHVLGFLTAARYGLTEDEMLAVLAANDTVWTDFEQAKQHDLPAEMLAAAGGEFRQLPVVIWSRLYLDLEPYLTERLAPGGVTTITFYHRQLAERVDTGGLLHNDPLLLHIGIANCFGTRWKYENHAVSELPYHQTRAEMWGHLERTLSDLTFVDSKCAIGLTHDLLADYQRALPPLKAGALGRPPADELELIFSTLTRFAQMFANHPLALFSTLCHVSTGRLRDLCETYALDWKKTWIRTVRVPVDGPSPRNHTALEVRSKYSFEGRRLAASSPRADRAFYLKALGQIAVVNTAIGIELSATIAVRPRLPLGLASSEDAEMLAVAFDQGELDVIRLDLGAGHHQSVRTVSYLVPDFEAPVLRWAGRTLWFQAERQTIAAVDADGERLFELPLPPECHGELGAMVSIGDGCIAAIRHDRGSSLVKILSGEVQASRALPSMDVTCLCKCGHDQIACGLSNYSMVIFSVSTLEEQFRVATQELSTSAVGSETAVLWASDQGHLYSWCFMASEHPEQMDDKGILGYGPRVLNIASGHDLTTVVTEGGVVTFSMGATPSSRTWPIERVFLLEDGKIALGLRREDDLWLIDPLNRRDARLGRFNSQLLSIDAHRHVLAASSSGSYVWLDWPEFKTSYYSGAAGIERVVPAAESGFWLVDYRGTLFFLSDDFSITESARLDSNSAHCRGIIAWPGWLLVLADGQKSGGGDTHEFLIFLRVEQGKPPKLERYGVRALRRSEGFLQGAYFDPRTDRLFVLTRRDGDGILHCRAGSPLAFLNRSESIHDVECHEWVTGIAGAAGGQPPGLLLHHDGIVSYVDEESKTPQAFLVADGSITAIASDRAGEAIMVESRQRLFKCEVLRGITNADVGRGT